MWPGNLSNDTTGQLCMFYSAMGNGSYAMSAQHPVFDTLVFGAITYPFYALGHYKVGVSVCIALQAVATALSFGSVLTWMRRRWYVSLRPLMMGMWFLALCPVVPLMVLSLSKDTFFSWVYVVWLILFLSSLREERPAGSRRTIALVVLGILMCLTKKYGVFVVAGSYACMLLKWVFALRGGSRRRCWATGLILMLTLALGVGGNSALDALTHATPDMQQDKLLVPIQQTAMCYSRHPEDYTEEDCAALSGLMNLQAIDEGSWDPQSTDTVKVWTYTGDSLASEKPQAFIRVWLSHLPGHVIDYWDGWATLVAPLFSFGDIVPLFDSHWHTWGDASIVPESAYLKSDFAAAASASIESWYSWLGSVPILGVLLLQTLYAVLLPAWFLSCAIHLRGRISLVAVAPTVISFAALLISPMTIPHFETMRYLISFVYTAPVLLCYPAAGRYRARLRE